jgi:adenosylhomocysteine nucleosidase
VQQKTGIVIDGIRWYRFRTMSFQQLITRWLTAQATEAVKKEIFSSSSPEPGTEIACSEEADSLPTDIGFVFAMPMEAAGIVDRLTDRQTTIGDGRKFHTGKLRKFRVAVVESGVGQKKAASATEVLIDTFHPRRLVSAGYSGALSEEQKRFAIRIPSVVVRESDGQTIELGSETDDSVRLLTTDFVVATAKRKKSLGEKHQAALVDMETFAVAERCREHGVPFLSVRIVLDTATESLPKDVHRIMKSAERSTARLAGSVLGSLFSRPSALLDLYTLKERALDATDRLAKRIYSEITQDG